jgi:hypothetical protein
MKTALYCLLICYLGIWASCNKNINCTENIYSFNMGIKAYPSRDSMNVGDTVWLEVNEPTTLNDVQTGRTIDYSGTANLGSAIGFQALSSLSGQFTVESVQKFDFVLSQGVEVINRSPGLYKEYFFDEVNKRYIFILGVIPKEKGIFSVVFSNAASVYRKNDKCTKANFTLNFKNTDQHYYLNPNFQGGPTPVGGDYYFKVY